MNKRHNMVSVKGKIILVIVSNSVIKFSLKSRRLQYIFSLSCLEFVYKYRVVFPELFTLALFGVSDDGCF
jgi:hypothetical protein